MIVLILEREDAEKRSRKNQICEVIAQIQQVSTAVYTSKAVVDGSDLTLRRLGELQKQLQSLQKEKSDRRKQVLEYHSAVNSLCSVLGLDLKETVRELHPSLVDSEENYSISTHTLQQLESSIKSLWELK